MTRSELALKTWLEMDVSFRLALSQFEDDEDFHLLSRIFHRLSGRAQAYLAALYLSFPVLEGTPQPINHLKH